MARAPKKKPKRHGPLAGLRVLDLSLAIMGPYCTQILADLGADVIKIESPDGDTTRFLPPRFEPDRGAMFLNIGRGKRSIVLDLKRPAACAVLHRMVKDADVFVHSMRRAAIERLGFCYNALAALNPALVYVNLYGYGHAGPYADQPAYDDVIQAQSGLADLQGGMEAGPPRYVASVVADKIGGMTGVYAALAALYHRERTGEGQEVEVPMFETMVSFLLTEHLAGALFETPLGPPVYARAVSPDRRPYRTRDGYIAVLIYNDKQWQRFFEALDHPAWTKDPIFSSFPARADNIDAVLARLSSVLAERTTAEWMSLLSKAEIPAAPVQSTADLMSDPHLAATGFWVRRTGPEGSLRFPGIPTGFSKTPGAITDPGPGLGAQSAEILSEFGYEADEIAALTADGAVGAKDKSAKGTPGVPLTPRPDAN